jgi:hypothetical protein
MPVSAKEQQEIQRAASHAATDRSAQTRRNTKHGRHSSRRHRSRRSGSRLRRRLRTFVTQGSVALGQLPFWGSLLLLLLLPLAMGGGELWALPSALLCCLLFYGCWGISALLPPSAAPPLRLHWLCVLPLSLLAIGILQCLPATGLVAGLSPSALTHWRRLDALGLGEGVASISVAPDLTARYCLYALVVLLLLVLLCSYCRSRFRVIATAMAVVVAVAIQALVAYYPFFSGKALFYWQADIEPDVLFGAFLNRNHFGFLMGMGALLSLGLIFAAMHSRERVLAKSKNSTHKRLKLLLIPLVVIWFFVQVSQVFSLSRGAFLGTVPVAMVLVAAWLFRPYGYLRRGHSSTRQNVLMAVSVLLCALFIALPEALPRLSERYERLMNDQIVTKDARFVLWRESLPMLRDYWLCGIGLGNYAQVMPQYESDYTPMTLPNNAHNDWLELMLEIGAPTALALYALFALFLVLTFQRLRRQQDTILRWIGFAAFSALIMGMIHELVDYSLRAPANGLIYTALVVLVLACGSLTVNEKRGSSRQGKRRRDAAATLRWPQRAGLFVLAVVALLALPAAYRRVLSSSLQVKMIETIARQDRAREKRYPLLKNEYKRLIDLSSQILELTPDLGEILLRRAVCFYHLAQLSWEVDDESIVIANYYAEQATVAIDAACQRYPLDGRFHQARAAIHENAGWCAGKYDEDLIATAYEQALASYPCYAPSLRDAAAAYLRSSRRLAWRPDQQQLAEQHRARASDLYKSYLRSVPWYAGQIMAELWELGPEPAQLGALIPANFQAQRALYNFFMQQQLYEAALTPLDDMEELNRLELPLSELRRLSPYERRQYRERSQAELGLWLAGERLVVQGLLRRWADHALAWDAYRQELADKEARELAKARSQWQKGQLRLAEGTLQSVAWELPHAYETRLMLGEIYLSLGRWQELATALSLFVYDPAPMADDYLARALVMMEQMLPVDKPGEFTKYRFVEAALKVRRNENSPHSDRRQLTECLQVFAELTAWNAANPARAWIQRHLLDLYVGRVHELLGNAAAAAVAYRKGLEISPQNLWLRQRLAALAAPHGEPDELSARLAELLPSRHYFNSDVCLLGYSIQPAQLQHLHENATVMQAWLCLDDINEDRSVLLNFYNNGARIFADNYNFVQEERPMVSWRVGEIWLQERSYRPLLLAYRQSGGHPWANGPVAAEFFMRDMNRRQARQQLGKPRAYVPVFDFAVARE